MAVQSPPNIQFYRFFSGAPSPIKAGRTAEGNLPLRSVRYCEAATTASSFGWWVYPPMDFSLRWDGHEIYCTWPGLTEWYQVKDGVRLPSFSETFNSAAPEAFLGRVPPFLCSLPENGIVQIWTGLFVRTAPGWSLLSRAPANMPFVPGSFVYEGLMETDRWFLPVFTNLSLLGRKPITLLKAKPLIQMQPIPREAYSIESGRSMQEVVEIEMFDDQVWKDYGSTLTRSEKKREDRLGTYAIDTRRRMKQECMFGGGVAG